MGLATGRLPLPSGLGTPELLLPGFAATCWAGVNPPAVPAGEDDNVGAATGCIIVGLVDNFYHSLVMSHCVWLIAMQTFRVFVPVVVAIAPKVFER